MEGSKYKFQKSGAKAPLLTALLNEELTCKS